MNLIENLIKLVEMDTTNPPGNEGVVVKYLKDLFEERTEVVEIRHDDNRSSIIIRFKGKKEEKISIIGHIDTVPIGDPNSWTYDPFKATVENGYIYGRGTSDMKSGLACMISLGNHLIEKYKELPIGIDLVFTADEETGGVGVKEIRKLGYFNDTIFVVIPEPTSLKLGTKEKGALWLELKILGKSAHGAYPQHGLNAILAAVSVYQEIENYLNDSPLDSLLDKSTTSLNRITGGNKINMVADSCRITIDIRYTPFFKVQQIKTKLDSIIEKNKSLGYDISYQFLNDRASLETDPNSKHISILREVLAKLDIVEEEMGIYYYTDASDVVPILDIPFLVFGPGFEDECHKPNERALISNIEMADKIFISWIDAIIKSECK